MTNKNILTGLFVALGLGGIGFGVYSYYLKNLEILEDFTYKLVGIKFLSASFDSVKVEMSIEVVNNADISVKVTNYFFDVYVNGVKVGNISNADLNQELKGRGGKSVFNVQVDIDPTSFIGTGVVGSLRNNFSQSKIRLDGNFGLKKGFIKLKNLPLDETWKVSEFM
jgi:LEA14-like dessication related protein